MMSAAQLLAGQDRGSETSSALYGATVAIVAAAAMPTPAT